MRIARRVYCDNGVYKQKTGAWESWERIQQQSEGVRLFETLTLDDAQIYAKVYEVYKPTKIGYLRQYFYEVR